MIGQAEIRRIDVRWRCGGLTDVRVLPDHLVSFPHGSRVRKRDVLIRGQHEQRDGSIVVAGTVWRDGESDLAGKDGLKPSFTSTAIGIGTEYEMHST